MFDIKRNNVITMTRGDTAHIEIKCGYELQDGDEVVMTIKKRLKDTDPVLSIKPIKDWIFELEPDDTIDLLGNYVYDVQLTTAEGEVYTLVLSEIIFMRGVTE